MRLFLVRHGETEWNIQRRMQGWGDSPLTPQGVEHARNHGILLKREGVESIFASDLGRVKSTVSHIQENCEVPVAYHTNLRECSMGLWEGHQIDDIKAQWPKEYDHWRHGDESVSSPEGESLNAVKDRVKKTLQPILSSDHRCIALVTHGGTTRILLELLVSINEDDKKDLRIYNDVVHLVTENESNRRVCHYVAGQYAGDGIHKQVRDTS